MIGASDFRLTFSSIVCLTSKDVSSEQLTAESNLISYFASCHGAYTTRHMRPTCRLLDLVLWHHQSAPQHSSSETSLLITVQASILGRSNKPLNPLQCTQCKEGTHRVKTYFDSSSRATTARPVWPGSWPYTIYNTSSTNCGHGLRTADASPTAPHSDLFVTLAITDLYRLIGDLSLSTSCYSPPTGYVLHLPVTSQVLL